jgi:hypothetical protein
VELSPIPEALVLDLADQVTPGSVVDHLSQPPVCYYTSSDRLEALLGFCALIAIRLLQLRDRAKTAPEAPATRVASLLAIKLVAARRHLSVTGMTVAEFWRGVAGLGGFLDRRNDGPPGGLSLWRG